MDKEYKAGFYQSDRDIHVFKSLSNESRVDTTGKIEKTYGTWSTEANNMLTFTKGVRTELSITDVNNATIRQLIDSGILVRVL